MASASIYGSSIGNDYKYDVPDSLDYYSPKCEWDVFDLLTDDYNEDFFSTNSCSSSKTTSSLFYAKSLPATLHGPHSAIFESFSEMDGVWQSLIVRAEGLWAFGHLKEACFIGRKVAEHIICHPPDQKIMCCGAFVKPKRRKVFCFKVKN